MSTRYNNGSHYENHQRAAELQDGAAHAHRVGEGRGESEHLTSHEHSRQESEHSQTAFQQAQAAMEAHANAQFGHAEIESLARELWESRGRPEGSPEEDWFKAVSILRARYLAAR